MNIFHCLQARSHIPVGRLARLTLLTSALILVGPVAAQQSGSSGSGAYQDQTGTDAGHNLDVPSGESSSRSPQDQATFPNAPSASRNQYVPVSSLTLGDRFRIYRQAVLRPYSGVGPAFGAGIGQWEDEPPEWGQGGQGYGRRFASGISRQFISETVRFGVAAADGEDPRYHRWGDSGFWDRTKHVVVESFTSETASGKRIPAYSRFAGTYGAAFISNAWYPDSRSGAGWALRRGSTALASSVGFHMFEEFMPRKYFKALGLGDGSKP
jgi:hypothetical protein